MRPSRRGPVRSSSPASRPSSFTWASSSDGGTVFDDHTQKNGRPEIFTIGERVIDGWQEALPGMKTGEIRKLIVPPELGYGARGQPPTIPPNATLLFEVELVKILGG